MAITIKKATIDDISVVAPLFDAYRQFYNQQPDVVAAAQFLTERVNNNESVIFVASDGDDAVGFTQLFPIFSSVGLKRTWLLNDLYVTKSARGKGIATDLLLTAKQLGVETNSRWLLLETANDNVVAQKLYEKNNWKKVDEYCFYTLKITS